MRVYLPIKRWVAFSDSQLDAWGIRLPGISDVSDVSRLKCKKIDSHCSGYSRAGQEKSGTHNSVIYCLALAYNDTSGMWIIAESTQKVVTSVTLVTGHKSKYSMFYTLKTEIGFKN